MKRTTSIIKDAYTRLKQAMRDKMDALWLKNVKCTLNSITYSDYIDFICDNRYKSMLKRNIYTPIRIIMQGFALLNEQYTRVCASSSVVSMVRISDEIKRKIEMVNWYETMLVVLRRKQSEGIIDVLVKLCIVGKNDSYDEIIGKLKANIAGRKYEIKTLELQLKDLKPKIEAIKVRSDYVDEFVRLQQWYGQPISENIQMSKYVAIQNQYIIHFESKKTNTPQNNG